MTPETKLITFKSWPSNFEKERDGTKPNTIRKLPTDRDRQVFLYKLAGPWKLKSLEKSTGVRYYIKIANTQTGDHFTRHITDVTLWRDLFIISWDHPNKKRSEW